MAVHIVHPELTIKIYERRDHLDVVPLIIADALQTLWNPAVPTTPFEFLHPFGCLDRVLQRYMRLKSG